MWQRSRVLHWTHRLITVVVITTEQLHSTKPELRFSADSNPARGVSEIRDGQDLSQWSRLEIRLNSFRRSTIPPIHYHHHHHHHHHHCVFVLKLRACEHGNPCALKINSNCGLKGRHMESWFSITKNIISPLQQCLWPPYLAGWWLAIRGSHP